MKEVKVLGSGCAKCAKVAELIAFIADDCGIAVTVEKETNPEVIMRYGVMRTPAVVVDEQVMHAGSIPEKEQVEAWLKE